MASRKSTMAVPRTVVTRTRTSISRWPESREGARAADRGLSADAALCTGQLMTTLPTSVTEKGPDASPDRSGFAMWPPRRAAAAPWMVGRRPIPSPDPRESASASSSPSTPTPARAICTSVSPAAEARWKGTLSPGGMVRQLAAPAPTSQYTSERSAKVLVKMKRGAKVTTLLSTAWPGAAVTMTPMSLSPERRAWGVSSTSREKACDHFPSLPAPPARTLSRLEKRSRDE
mmetsp:Transcript_18549/g.58649  ORF Transcript_18549/g.58649 Transcript_18549/m.58649 type:complete len:231 (-) Transcript_18549:1757-2449(-)